MNVATIELPTQEVLRGETDEQRELALRLRALWRSGSLDLPLLAQGRTARRHRLLTQIAREDLPLGRVAEAHADAVSVLAEANRVPRYDGLYGVWAADAPHGQLHLIERRDGEWCLSGRKQYCSGSTFLDAALVTALWGEQILLVEVPLGAHLCVDTGGWKSPAFRSTATGCVTFNELPVTPLQVIGNDRWYLQRPGFWHGAVGPAACWAGGALGLIDAVAHNRRANPHFQAHLGALEAAAWGMESLLRTAGEEIDADPEDRQHCARRRALSVRHLIERLCTEVLDRFGRATGPALLAFDEPVGQRYLELTMYIRQCHAERDLETLAVRGTP